MSESKDIISSLREIEKNESKNQIIKQIDKNCRDIASNFFDCMEDKYRTFIKNHERSICEVEKTSNEEFVPFCMNEYNLEMCLKNLKYK